MEKLEITNEEKLNILKNRGNISKEITFNEEVLFSAKLEKIENKEDNYILKCIRFFDVEEKTFGDFFKDFNNEEEAFHQEIKGLKNKKNIYSNNPEIRFIGKFSANGVFIYPIYKTFVCKKNREKYEYIKKKFIEEYKNSVSKDIEKRDSLIKNNEENTLDNVSDTDKKEYYELNLELKKLRAEFDSFKDDEFDNLKKDTYENQNSIENKFDSIEKDVYDINKKIESINIFKRPEFITKLKNTKLDSKKYDDSINHKEAIENISNWIYENKKVKYNKFTIKQFFAAMHTNQILILSGKPGTGKTSLVESFSQAVGIEYKMISVQPNWYENQDIMGFYNPIEKLFNSTPVIDFLIEAKHNPNKLHILCFDEMNLAQTEYYLSEFLSKMETEKREIEFYSRKLYESNFSQSMETIRFIVKKYAKEDKKNEYLKKLSNEDEYLGNILDLIEEIEFEEIEFQAFDRFCKEKAKLENYAYYGNSIEIPENVRFVGTINKDETTKNISPKVIDRSLIMEVKALDSLENTTKKDSSKENKESKKCCLSAEYFKVRKDDKESEAFKIKMAKIKKDFKTILKIDLNGRFDKHVRELYNSEVFEIEENKNDSLLDAIILMKIIPKINIYIDSDKNDKLKKEISPLFEEYNHSKEVYDDMEEYCYKNEVFTFWR